MDFTSITAAVSVTGLVAGIIAMAVVKVGPGVAKWGSNKLATFFG